MNYILMFQTIDFSRYIFYKTSDIIRLYLNVFLITKVIDVHSRKYKELEKKNSNHFQYQPSSTENQCFSLCILCLLLSFPFLFFFFFALQNRMILHVISKTDVKRHLVKISYVSLPGLFILKQENVVSLPSDVIPIISKAARLSSYKPSLITSSPC